MSALLDEFRSVLSSYRDEVATWVNQGFIVSIDEHLKRLEAAAPAVEADAKGAVHQILTDLYTAWHAPAPDVPAAPATPEPAPADAAPAAPAEEPPPATGGTISAPAVVGEPGPETVSLPDGAEVVPAAPATDPVPAADVAPAADTAAPTES